MQFGILGGNGVLASTRLLEIINNAVLDKNIFRNSDHPQIVLFQATHTPSRSLFLEGKGESFLPHYEIIIKKLEHIGCNFIAIPCNTAHFFINELQNITPIPIINMIHKVAQKIVTNYYNTKTVVILSSDGSAKKKVYDHYLLEQNPNLKIIYPNRYYQKRVTECIINVQKGFHLKETLDNEHPQLILKEIIEYFKNNCDLIILGCTELDLALNTDLFNIPVLSSLKILAESILEIWSKDGSAK